MLLLHNYSLQRGNHGSKRRQQHKRAREKVRAEIKDLLKQRLVVYNVSVDDFSIVNFRFSQQFTQAIDSKQTAEQYALKAQRDLERIKIEAEQKIAQATAEAEALRLQKANVTPELVRLRQMRRP